MRPMENTGAPESPGGPPPVDTLDLKGKMDRFGDLLAKSMELAEVGMNLSLSILSTVGAAAQQKIAQKLAETTETAAATGFRAPPAPSSAAPEPVDYGITNRLPLAPGGTVAISFSVNNEAATGPKDVILEVEGFAGDRTGLMLPLDSLSVSPASGAIAPMDFEKFVLRGIVPADAAPDVYRGAVAVVSDTVIRIPVWLVVESAPA